MKALNDNTHPLESLLQQHCPNGVEFKELGELELNKILNLGRGKIISQNDLKNCPGEYPVYSSSATKNGEIGKYGKYMFDDERITWSIDGGGKFFYRNHLKYSVTNVCGWIKVINLDELNTKFLFYALINEWVKKKFNYTKKAHPSIIKKEYCIPLPPLEIQSKIVEILDTFTELQAELEAELEARLKQYHYYRNKLLSHDELENRTAKSRNDSDPTTLVPYVRLGEVCEKISNIKWKEMQNQTFKYIDLTSVDRENCQITQTQTITKENAPSRAQQIVQTDDVICGTTRPTLQRYCYITKQYDGQICSTGFCVLRANKTQILPKWIFFNLKTNNFLKHIERFQQGASYPSIADADLKKFQIPLPPLEVQNEIVELLDKFDTLTNDLTSGIPAEIEARKKQYEYYRERLLSFIAKD
ncbi:restriction endonuclease subunit S [Campylobacter upsaliensis]|nr:restriction endonuclease subunit S [Campylobacter upsaliensis]